MKLRINALKEGQQTIETTLVKEDLAIVDNCFANPIAASLSIYKGTHEITINGTLETDLDLECDRCLADYQLNIQTDFCAILSQRKKSAAENDESIILITPTTFEVDLTPFARDALLLAIPMKKVCNENCRGICAGCGADLNREKCRCTRLANDDRWQPLKNLLTKTMEE
jgi:uncharacterized protein